METNKQEWEQVYVTKLHVNTSSDYQYMYLHVIKHFAVNEGVL